MISLIKVWLELPLSKLINIYNNILAELWKIANYATGLLPEFWEQVQIENEHSLYDDKIVLRFLATTILAYNSKTVRPTDTNYLMQTRKN